MIHINGGKRILDEVERSVYGCTHIEYRMFNATWNTIKCEEKYRYRLMNINPRMQPVVLELIKLIEHEEYLHKIILFGSSVTNYCWDDSDIDIAVEFMHDFDKYESYSNLIDKLSFIKDIPVDIVVIDEDTGYDLIRNIKRGVVLNERKKDVVADGKYRL